MPGQFNSDILDSWACLFRRAGDEAFNTPAVWDLNAYNGLDELTVGVAECKP